MVVPKAGKTAAATVVWRVETRAVHWADSWVVHLADRKVATRAE